MCSLVCVRVCERVCVFIIITANQSSLCYLLSELSSALYHSIIPQGLCWVLFFPTLKAATKTRQKSFFNCGQSKSVPFLTLFKEPKGSDVIG